MLLKIDIFASQFEFSRGQSLFSARIFAIDGDIFAPLLRIYQYRYTSPPQCVN